MKKPERDALERLYSALTAQVLNAVIDSDAYTEELHAALCEAQSVLGKDFSPEEAAALNHEAAVKLLTVILGRGKA